MQISTHTLTWSVTLFIIFTPFFTHFNSHAHVERDMCGTNFGNGAKISTHTLTWSVTIAGVKLVNALYDFNSHAHVERDGYLKFL